MTAAPTSEKVQRKLREPLDARLGKEGTSAKDLGTPL